MDKDNLNEDGGSMGDFLELLMMGGITAGSILVLYCILKIFCSGDDASLERYFQSCSCCNGNNEGNFELLEYRSGCSLGYFTANRGNSTV